MFVEGFFGFVVYVLLDGFEEFWDFGGEFVNGYGVFFVGVMVGEGDNVFGCIFGIEFKFDGNVFYFLVVEFLGWGVVFVGVDFGVNVSFFENC